MRGWIEVTTTKGTYRYEIRPIAGPVAAGTVIFTLPFSTWWGVHPYIPDNIVLGEN
jgi:hypothetical protein